MEEKRKILTLQAQQVEELEAMLKKGSCKVRMLKRVQVLLALHAGMQAEEVLGQVEVSLATVYNVANRYKQAGNLSDALQEKPRSGQPSKFDKATQAQLTALACSEPPLGHSRWTLRLLADKLVELRLVEAISHKAVGEQLKKMHSNPG